MKLKKLKEGKTFLHQNTIFKKEYGEEYPFGANKPIKYNAVDVRKNEIHLLNEEMEVTPC